MKILKYAILLLTSALFFSACQKEFSLETAFSGAKATGSLKDSTGNCLPIVISGNYASNNGLTDSNFVTVQVNFSSPGSYSIATDTSNGFSFQGSGVMADSGIQNIILKGIGKPVLPQPTNFSIVFDANECTFSVDVKGDTTGVGKAAYTFAGAPGNCANATVSGDYQEGSPLDATNQVSLNVDVTTAGTFAIATTTVNGMTFSSQQGVFTDTGRQVIVLQGTGIPDTAGTSAIPITDGSTSCSFTVTVNRSVAPGADSAWQFSVGTNFFHGFIDTALTHTDTSINNATALSFYGSSYPGPDTLFQIDILLPDNTIKPGIYNTDSANADFFLYNVDTTKAPYFQAYSTVTPPVNIEVNIKTYDSATGILTGTFSGTAINESGQKITVTGGRIYARVE